MLPNLWNRDIQICAALRTISAPNRDGADGRAPVILRRVRAFHPHPRARPSRRLPACPTLRWLYSHSRCCCRSGTRERGRPTTAAATAPAAAVPPQRTASGRAGARARSSYATSSAYILPRPKEERGRGPPPASMLTQSPLKLERLSRLHLWQAEG